MVLLLLAIPVLSLRMGFGDTGNLKTDQTPRRAYDLLAEGFGPGFNGPIIVTVAGPDAQDPAALASFTDTLRDTPGRRGDDGRDPGGRRPRAGPGVRRQRAAGRGDREPRAPPPRTTSFPQSVIDAKVGGFNAASVDFAEYLERPAAVPHRRGARS